LEKAQEVRVSDMVNWIVRILLILAGVIAGWFVAPDSNRFDIIQMVIALFLFAFFLAVAAFWPSLVRWRRGKA